MKTLYLVRHAKAVSRERPIPDFERPLRKRGRHEARRMAQYVKRHGPAPDVILSSPASRAIETARLFAEVWHYPAETIMTLAALYEPAESAAADSLLHQLQALHKAHQTVMIVGHDPFLTAWAHVLDHDFAESLPTCGVVCCAFLLETWADIAPDSGMVRFFHAPKRAAPWRPRSADEVATALVDQLHQTLAAWHPDIAAQMQPVLQKVATKVARQFVKTLHAPPQQKHRTQG
jgi:phosphohistidine phosphatase